LRFQRLRAFLEVLVELQAYCVRGVLLLSLVFHVPEHLWVEFSAIFRILRLLSTILVLLSFLSDATKLRRGSACSFEDQRSCRQVKVGCSSTSLVDFLPAKLRRPLQVLPTRSSGQMLCQAETSSCLALELQASLQAWAIQHQDFC
jgi:hypothetical protein